MTLYAGRRYRKLFYLVFIAACLTMFCSLLRTRKSFDEGSTARRAIEGLRKAALCTPVNYVLFSKLHKTGSSTVTNILNRYGDKRTLNVLLPRNTRNRSTYTFYWPHDFMLRFAAPLFGREANILCNHARYNSRSMQWIFPKKRSRYITMLREPFTQFESVFNFMGYAKYLGLQNVRNPLELFLETPERFLRKLLPSRGASSLLKNPMMFDLGFPRREYDNETLVQAYIESLASDFDLVMIMEYFDESLVLLKRILCWKTEDILYFKLNERRKEDQRPNDLNERSRSLILQWNSADHQLYSYFNQTLWAKIRAEGPAFYDDLRAFREKKKAREETCLRKGNYEDEAYTGRFVRGYALKRDLTSHEREMCERMIRNEITYIDYFRKKQRLLLSDIV